VVAAENERILAAAKSLIKKEKTENKKQSIPKSVKTHVWNNYIGENIPIHRCLCCKKTLIQNTNFDVGHVISEKDGGTHEINNLRPICSVCNHSMGTENMVDFVKKYGYYI
jgi:5-methylcytosine-specific restriction endonuclease McrA